MIEILPRRENRFLVWDAAISPLSLTTRFFVTGEQKFLQLKKGSKVGVLFQTKKRLTNLASKRVRIQLKPKRSNSLAIQYIFGLDWKGNI